MGRLRSSPHAADVAVGAQRAIDQLVRNGTTAARVQVEIDPAVGHGPGRAPAAARRGGGRPDRAAARRPSRSGAWPPRACPSCWPRPWPPGSTWSVAARTSTPIPVRHLDLVFALAERHAQAGRPAPRLQRRPRPIAPGPGGRAHPGPRHAGPGVDRPRHDAGGHGPRRPAPRRSSSSPTAGISLVVMPVTDLHLTGHGDPGRPEHGPDRPGRRRRGPGGDLQQQHRQPVRAVRQRQPAPGGVAGRRRRPRRRSRRAGRCCSTPSPRSPASILGLDPHGPFAGGAAHLAVLDTLDADAVVLAAPTVLAPCATAAWWTRSSAITPAAGRCGGRRQLGAGRSPVRAKPAARRRRGTISRP